MHMNQPLTEIEDRLLAIADEEWCDLLTSHSILEAWFDLRISMIEIQQALMRLIAEKLVSCLAIQCHENGFDFVFPVDISLVKYKATELGVNYLETYPG